MNLPTYQEMMLPVLQALSIAGEELHHKDYASKAADLVGLTDEQRAATLPSGGQTYLYNRSGWAGWYMMQAGLVEKPKRGFLKITEAGKRLLATKPSRIDKEVLAKYPSFVERVLKSKPSDPETSTEQNAQTPDEQIEVAYQNLNSTLASDLLDIMKKMDPYKFEQLVVDLLSGMGYGGSREEAASVTQKSNDQGIDGVIKEDRLGLDVIYIQAKRWESVVGRPEIQNFVGALAGKQAHKGVFITTSAFQKSALEYVQNISQKVVLIDGARLAELMIEHNIGVSTTRTISLKRVDSDYFEE